MNLGKESQAAGAQAQGMMRRDPWRSWPARTGWDGQHGTERETESR